MANITQISDSVKKSYVELPDGTFAEKVVAINSDGTAISGGGGGGTTFIGLYTDSDPTGTDNRYSIDWDQDPPVGDTAGAVINLPLIDVGQTYTFTGISSADLDVWAIELPSIPGTDLAIFYGDYVVNAKNYQSPGEPLVSGTYIRNLAATGVTDRIYLYGGGQFQIIRLPNVTVTGFGTLALFSPITIPTILVEPFPDPAVYPFTNVITP